MNKQYYKQPMIIVIACYFSKRIMAASWYEFGGDTDNPSVYAPDGGSFEIINNDGPENDF